MFGMPTWAIKVAGGALLAILVTGMGARLAQIWYAPQVTGLKAQIAASNTQAKAVTVAHKAITKADAAGEVQAQAAIVQQARIIIRKVPVYVSKNPLPPVGCITNGMLRLHDAAVLGIDPADLSPPAAQSDDACSAVSPSDFMATVVNNYAAARQNGEQLNSLEVDINNRLEALAPSIK